MTGRATGETCPAALPLCLCGIRGCALADQHAAAFIEPARGRGRFARAARRRRRT